MQNFSWKGEGEKSLASSCSPGFEAQRRRENKEGRTRFIREMDTHQTYSEFNAEFDRYVELSGGNPHIAYGIMLRLLRQLPDSSIRKLAEIDNQG